MEEGEIVMSKRLKNGTWVMPKEHVEEFMQYIDYKKLITDCMESMKQKQPSGKSIKVNQPKPVKSRYFKI